MLAELPASLLRDELVRRVAGRLELTEGRLTALLSSGGVRRAADDGSQGSAGPDGGRATATARRSVSAPALVSRRRPRDALGADPPGAVHRAARPRC